MIKETFLNRKGKKPDEIVNLLNQKITALRNIFSFQKVEDIVSEGNSVSFEFTTKKRGTAVEPKSEGNQEPDA